MQQKNYFIISTTITAFCCIILFYLGFTYNTDRNIKSSEFEIEPEDIFIYNIADMDKVNISIYIIFGGFILFIIAIILLFVTIAKSD